MKRKKITLILTLILSVLIAIVAVLLIKDKDKSQGVTELYADDTEAFEIKTSYGNLYYPKKWENQVEITIETENGCEIVRFIAKTNDGKAIPIFDVIFGGDGYTVGMIKESDSDLVNINLISYKVEDDVHENVYKMAEDVNFVLQHLNEIENYEEM